MYIKMCVILSFFIFAQAGALGDTNVIQEANYSGEYKSFNIEMKRTLTQVDATHFRLETYSDSFFGKVKESEDFLWTKDNEIKPLQYQYEQKILGIKRRRQINYDWVAMTATAKDHDDKKTLKIPSDILGPLTYQLKLQLEAASGKKEFDYRFVNRTAIKHYIFASQDEVEIKINKKVFPHLLLIERTNEGDGRKTQIWLDKNNKFTLFRLQQTKNGKSHTLTYEDGHYISDLKSTPFEMIGKELPSNSHADKNGD